MIEEQQMHDELAHTAFRAIMACVGQDLEDVRVPPIAIQALMSVARSVRCDL